jgi:hypothetical protein
MKNLNIEFFRNAGRQGGVAKTDKKKLAAKENLKKARERRWVEKEQNGKGQ